MKTNKIEGYTVSELIHVDDLSKIVLVDRPIVFKVGDAEILGQFSLADTTLVAELGVAEGGGGGTLRSLVDAIEKVSRRNRITAIDWRIYAVDCPTPNPKLTRILEHYQFIREQPDNGPVVYRRVTSTNDTVLRRR